MVSMLAGRLYGVVFSARFSFGEDCVDVSVVGDRGPPHWLMKESTAVYQ